jgi:hypothetical protein
MAQLNSRGTMIRGRWDFFEQSDGFSFIYGSVPSGLIGAYLANNSSGAAMLDIYNFTWSASQAATWELAYLVPPLVLTPLVPSEQFIHPLNALSAAPPGFTGMYSNNAGVYWTIKRYSQPSTGENFAPIAQSYFVTLQPGWAIAIAAIPASGPTELSLTVWYQEVTDNIAPAK